MRNAHLRVSAKVISVPKPKGNNGRTMFARAERALTKPLPTIIREYSVQNKQVGLFVLTQASSSESPAGRESARPGLVTESRLLRHFSRRGEHRLRSGKVQGCTPPTHARCCKVPAEAPRLDVCEQFSIRLIGRKNRVKLELKRSNFCLNHI